ncbi:hypothetical protein LXL04_029393 [Taraxacum kok-saghyz]
MNQFQGYRSFQQNHYASSRKAKKERRKEKKPIGARGEEKADEGTTEMEAGTTMLQRVMEVVQMYMTESVASKGNIKQTDWTGPYKKV